MYPEVTIGSLTISMYSIMTAIGVVFGLLVAYFQIYKGEKISSNTGWRLIICAAIGALFMYFGASFFDSLFHSIEDGVWRRYGITYLGGVVVGFPVTIILIHFLVPAAKGRALYVFSLMVPAVVLAHAFGRIGCFFAGCCYGKVTDLPIGIVFPPGSDAAISHFGETLGKTQSSLPVLPTMLFESAFEFILFFLMLGFRKKIKGHELEIYLFTYSIFRFILEFYRGDDRGSIGLGISPAQFLDIFCLVVAVLIFLFYRQIIFKKFYNKCLNWQEEYLSYVRKIAPKDEEDN